MSEPEPFLILHKVRGEAAFDIAHQMEMDDGAIWWIVSTSGHRAYPVFYTPVGQIVQEDVYDIFRIKSDLSSYGVPDHYQTSADRSKLATAVGSLLDLLNLKPKVQQEVKRRKV